MPRALSALTILLSCVAAGCSAPFRGPPTKAEIDAADYGPRPEQVQQRVSLHARNRYPEIVQINVGTPVTAWYGQQGGLTSSRDIRFGWAVPFKGYKIGFTTLHELYVEGTYFFRDDLLEGVADHNGFEFLDR